MILTLTTDFSTCDTYVAQMKGVILGISPQVRLVDITHNVPPQDVLAGALTLDSAVDAFPDGTIHLCVVDPGVGTRRAAIALQTRRFIVVGPDNGLANLVTQRHSMQRAVRLTNRKYHRQSVSDTFHGRDIFAPVAGHLANGMALDELGEPIDELIQLDLPHPEPIPTGLRLHVIHIDAFGNLVTDLHRNQVGLPNHTRIQIGDLSLGGIHRTFADVPSGEPVAYFGSSHRLEIALRNANAAEAWQIKVGDTVDVMSM